MTCHETNDSLEMYIVGDLDDVAARDVAAHLAGCAQCRRSYEERRVLISDLKDTAQAFQPTRIFRDLPDVAAFVERRAASAAGAASVSRRPAVRVRSRWAALAAAALAAALAAAVAVASVPALAEEIPLPIGHEISDLRDQNRQMHQQAVRMQEQIEQLKTEIITIQGQHVPQVDTANPALPPEVNAAVQGVVVKFIMAQYAGDMAAMKKLATPALQARMDQRPEDYLRDKAGKVSFAQLTDVSTYEEGGVTMYLEFVRLMDGKLFNQSQYQEDFGVVQSGGRYLVDSMETDA